MHIDVLWVGGGRVALVLSAVLAGRVRDDQARRGLLPLLADHHRPPALPVVRDDLPVVVPEHVGGVEVERPGLDDAGEVDGGALLDVELGGAEDGGNRLDDREVDPVLQVRGRRHLKILFVNDTASMTEVGYEDENCLKSTSVCLWSLCIFRGI